MKSKASAVWTGGLKDGKGSLSSTSGILSDTPYTFATRFEGAGGTNPEELIAAAHAGCFSMALSNILGEAGLKADKIDTTATVTLEIKDGAPTVTSSNLVTIITIPGADEAAVLKAAETAKAGCPISRLLNTEISLETQVNV